MLRRDRHRGGQRHRGRHRRRGPRTVRWAAPPSWALRRGCGLAVRPGLSPHARPSPGDGHGVSRGYRRSRRTERRCGTAPNRQRLEDGGGEAPGADRQRVPRRSQRAGGAGRAGPLCLRDGRRNEQVSAARADGLRRLRHHGLRDERRLRRGDGGLPRPAGRAAPVRHRAGRRDRPGHGAHGQHRRAMQRLRQERHDPCPAEGLLPGRGAARPVRRGGPELPGGRGAVASDRAARRADRRRGLERRGGAGDARGVRTGRG